MSYSLIDPIISTWASKNKLKVYNKYKDIEVRSINLVSPEGLNFQIWIDQPLNNKVSVHVWDYKKQRKDWCVHTSDLIDCLEKANATIKDWISYSLKKEITPRIPL